MIHWQHPKYVNITLCTSHIILGLPLENKVDDWQLLSASIVA